MIASESRARRVDIPPWAENPYRLVSLGEIMEAIKATGFVNHGNNLMLFRAIGFLSREFPKKIPAGDDELSRSERQPILECLKTLETDCGGLVLPVTLDKVERLKEKVQTSRITYLELDSECRELYERLTVELNSRLFMAIDGAHTSYYQDFLSKWAKVIDSFPSVSFDIEEASKCFALNRYTSCVYHLMRITEAALGIIAGRVGLESPRPGWEEAITYIEGQLNKNYQAMDALFKGDVEFLRGVAAHMRDVNVAWRRRVAHVESKYSDEEAERIYISTKGLMEHIATKLSEIEEDIGRE